MNLIVPVGVQLEFELANPEMEVPAETEGFSFTFDPAEGFINPATEELDGPTYPGFSVASWGYHLFSPAPIIKQVCLLPVETRLVFNCILDNPGSTTASIRWIWTLVKTEA